MSADDGLQSVTPILGGHVGASGEMAVAAMLLAKGLTIARPFPDDGIDLVALRSSDLARAVPIQVKTASGMNIYFERKWFKYPGIVLIHVRLANQGRRFYIFDGIADVEDFLGASAKSASWCQNGRYSSTKPSRVWEKALLRFEDGWNKIIEKLGDAP